MSKPLSARQANAVRIAKTMEQFLPDAEEGCVELARIAGIIAAGVVRQGVDPSEIISRCISALVGAMGGTVDVREEVSPCKRH